jgi:hypothetical protein
MIGQHTASIMRVNRKARSRDRPAYFCDPANILVAILLGKAQVLVQAKADVIAVQPVSSQAEVEKVLLERGGNRRFA